jgi:7-cyano-7-deazaguanine reductase
LIFCSEYGILANMNTSEQEIVSASGLGQETTYSDQYNPKVLYPIPRHYKRSELGITNETGLPFYGYDTWNDYETSWLNSKGKPVVAMTTFHIPCASPNIIESKSIKLYLNSFSGTRFSSKEEVSEIITRDLSKAAGLDVKVIVYTFESMRMITLTKPPGTCIDYLDLEIEHYEAKPKYLCTIGNTLITEILHTNLLKSNCPVTGQPDWATLIVEYEGPKLCREGLLKYIVSLRNQQEFHEQCIERIFMNILEYCKPSRLLVSGRYTRRGGKDINPYRSTDPDIGYLNQRLIRQ